MKKILLGVIALLLMAFFISCSSDDDNGTKVEEKASPIGTWRLGIPQIISMGDTIIPDTTDLTMIIKEEGGDTLFSIDVKQRLVAGGGLQSIYVSSGSADIKESAVILTGSSCEYYNPEVSLLGLTPLPDSLCNTPISILTTELTKDTWKVSGSSIAVLLSALLDENQEQQIAALDLELERVQ